MGEKEKDKVLKNMIRNGTYSMKRFSKIDGISKNRGKFWSELSEDQGVRDSQKYSHWREMVGMFYVMCAIGYEASNKCKGFYGFSHLLSLSRIELA